MVSESLCPFSGLNATHKASLPSRLTAGGRELEDLAGKEKPRRYLWSTCEAAGNLKKA